MKKIICALLLLGMIGMTIPTAEAAKQPVSKGRITGKTVGGGLLSLLIWPGIGQAMNDQPGNKVASHAIIGILPPFRFWSCYDAWVDRSGGYWEGRI